MEMRLCEFGNGTDVLDRKMESRRWVSDRLWEIEDIVQLVDAYERRKRGLKFQ